MKKEYSIRSPQYQVFYIQHVFCFVFSPRRRMKCGGDVQHKCCHRCCCAAAVQPTVVSTPPPLPIVKPQHAEVCTNTIRCCILLIFSMPPRNVSLLLLSFSREAPDPLMKPFIFFFNRSFIHLFIIFISLPREPVSYLTYPAEMIKGGGEA